MNGLNDRIDVFRYTLVDDGAGGEMLDDEDILYNNKPARLSTMNAEMQMKELGFTGKQLWRVIMEYSSLLLDLTGDVYVRLSYNAPESVILQGINYRVLKSRRQRDENNVSHHTSLIIEKDEAST